MKSRSTRVFNQFSAILFTVILISCTLKDRVPGNIPSKKEMADILADIHLVDNSLDINNIITNNKQLGYYKYTLDRHGITQAEFDSALVWYADHPKVYLDVYDKVIETLTEAEAKIQQTIKEDKQKATKDSVKSKDLWNLKQLYTLSGSDTLDAKIPFSIKLDSLKSLKNGKIKLSAWYTYKKDDMGKKDEMVLITCYANQRRDTLKSVIARSFTRVNTSVTQVIKTDTAVVSLEGYLLLHEQQIKRHLSISQISLEHIPDSTAKK